MNEPEPARCVAFEPDDAVLGRPEREHSARLDERSDAEHDPGDPIDGALSKHECAGRERDADGSTGRWRPEGFPRRSRTPS